MNGRILFLLAFEFSPKYFIKDFCLELRKLHDDIDKATAMAESLGQDHFVETRVGELTRCKDDWCGVSAFCTQWQNLIWKGENRNGDTSGRS